MILKENGNKKSKNEHVKECLFVNFSLFLPRSSKIYRLIIIVIIIIIILPRSSRMYGLLALVTVLALVCLGVSCS